MEKKNILLGICAGIASYKSCDLVRLLVKAGHCVKVVMSPDAMKFVTPLVFQSLSQNKVYTDMFSVDIDETTQHISLAQWADICVIAPLTANTLAKIATGICDNLLTTVVCALPLETRVILAPAMNTHMWENPIVKENLNKLKLLQKYGIVEPQSGELACGMYGSGRMAQPQDIYTAIENRT